MNIGFETDGKHDKFERPILIIKVFNSYTLWILPLTSRDKNGKYYYQMDFEGKRSTIILSQLRLISSKRLLRKIGMLSDNSFRAVKNQVKSFI